jgi:hypothetical protein
VFVSAELGHVLYLTAGIKSQHAARCEGVGGEAPIKFRCEVSEHCEITAKTREKGKKERKR